MPSVKIEIVCPCGKKYMDVTRTTTASGSATWRCPKCHRAVKYTIRGGKCQTEYK